MIIEIFTHTPPWVYALFVGLFLLGWQQSRSRNVKQFVIFLLPIGMLVLSFFGVTSSFGYGLFNIFLWLVGICLCALLGLKLFPTSSALYQVETRSFIVPGSWWPLVFIMAIFFTKYAVGVISSIDPELLKNISAALTLSLLYGVFSGAFFTRAIRVLKVKYQGNGVQKKQALG